MPTLPSMQPCLPCDADLIPAHIAHALLNVDDRQKEAHTSSVVARHAKVLCSKQP
jgi:hypothetical protein